MRSKKPKFRRQDTAYKLRLKKKSYRRPTGYRSGQRLCRRGKCAIPKIGYSEKKYTVFVIKTIDDIKKIPENSIVMVSSTLGKKKKYEIAKQLVKQKINIKGFDPQAFIKYVDTYKKVNESENIKNTT